MRDKTNAKQAAAILDEKRARKAGNGGKTAPAAIMRPMLAGKQNKTVKKFVKASNKEARRMPIELACAVRVVTTDARARDDGAARATTVPMMTKATPVRGDAMRRRRRHSTVLTEADGVEEEDDDGNGDA